MITVQGPQHCRAQQMLMQTYHVWLHIAYYTEPVERQTCQIWHMSYYAACTNAFCIRHYGPWLYAQTELSSQQRTRVPYISTMCWLVFQICSPLWDTAQRQYVAQQITAFQTLSITTWPIFRLHMRARVATASIHQAATPPPYTDHLMIFLAQYKLRLLYSGISSHRLSFLELLRAVLLWSRRDWVEFNVLQYSCKCLCKCLNTHNCCLT